MEQQDAPAFCQFPPIEGEGGNRRVGGDFPDAEHASGGEITVGKRHRFRARGADGQRS